MSGKTVVNNFLWYPHCRSEIFITLPTFLMGKQKNKSRKFELSEMKLL